MIRDKKVLAIIPARGGSKGVSRKNVREVAGKPLIAWTIQAAQESPLIDRLILSSDDPEIISVARKWGCEVPFTRPPELALDTTPGIDPVLHAIEAVPGFDLVVLLQPTSPLRITLDIDRCIEKSASGPGKMCLSVVKAPAHPDWMFSLDAFGVLHPISGEALSGAALAGEEKRAARRQDLSPLYVPNGAVYAAHCELLARSRSFLTPETVGYIMPEDRSLDIDTELDLKIADFLLRDVAS